MDTLPWLLNGTLSARDAATTTAHLHNCSACAKQAAEYELLWDLLTLDSSADSRTSRTSDLFAETDAERRVGDRVAAPPARRLLLVAAAVLLAVIGVSGWQLSTKPGSKPTDLTALTASDDALLTDSFEAGNPSGWKMVD